MNGVYMEIMSPTASGRPLVSFASVGRENTAKSADDRPRPGEMSLAGRISGFAVTCLFTTLPTRKRRVPTDAGKRLLRRWIHEWKPSSYAGTMQPLECGCSHRSKPFNEVQDEHHGQARFRRCCPSFRHGIVVRAGRDPESRLAQLQQQPAAIPGQCTLGCAHPASRHDRHPADGDDRHDTGAA